MSGKLETMGFKKIYREKSRLIVQMANESILVILVAMGHEWRKRGSQGDC